MAPVEKLWSIVKNKLNDSDISVKSKLISAILSIHVWNLTDDICIKDICLKLVELMPKRIKLLIQSKGHIKY